MTALATSKVCKFKILNRKSCSKFCILQIWTFYFPIGLLRFQEKYEFIKETIGPPSTSSFTFENCISFSFGTFCCKTLQFLERNFLTVCLIKFNFIEFWKCVVAFDASQWSFPYIEQHLGFRVPSSKLKGRTVSNVD